MRLSRPRCWLAAASLAFLAGIAGGQTKNPAAPSPGPSGYHLLKKIKLGGEGSWDYITFDSPTRRLFISRGTKVVVVNVDAQKVVGEIPDTPGVHGVALAPEFSRGFTSNGRGASVTIFDLVTLQTIGHVPTGENPDAILYDTPSKRVFTFNGRSHDATAIDAAAGKVAGTIPLGGKPEFAVADGAGHIYVNLEDKSEELQLDSANLSVTARWPMAPCESPSGLAIDSKHRRLFAGCENKLMAILDADTGRVVTTVPIGEGVDANRFDPGTGFAFSSNGRGANLTVVKEESPNQFRVVENVPTQRGARTMELDPATHEIFLVTADFGPPSTATPDNPHPRPTLVPDSFVVLVYGR